MYLLFVEANGVAVKEDVGVAGEDDDAEGAAGGDTKSSMSGEGRVRSS